MHMYMQSSVPGLKYKSIRGVTWLRDDPLPDIKTMIVTERRIKKNCPSVMHTVTLCLRFAVRVNELAEKYNTILGPV